MSTKLERIAARARREREAQFSSLSHLLNEEVLRESFRRLSRSAAPGIDQVTKEAYEERLDENLANLVGRLTRRAYKPQPVRRKYIPKDGSDKLRPIGIPALEDKLVQTGMTLILERIYEQDFMDFSYGFRPGRSCHDALRELDHIIMKKKVNYVVDADIRGYFDNVDHEWMMKFMRHRVTDTPMLQLVARFLKAGIVEDGSWRVTDQGVSQGGSISPIMANVYLHYTLDLWFERIVKRQCRGEAHVVRYADDFVACFQHRDDAESFYEALQERLAKFGLEVATEKTRIIEFGRFATENRQRRGEKKPATFDFLGFTHYCGKKRDGRFCVKRKTAWKKYRAKVNAIKTWIRTNSRHLPLKVLWPKVNAKMRGHYQYYGVTDNSKSLHAYDRQVKQALHMWLNRRSQRGSYSWAAFQRLLVNYPLARPKITVSLYPRRT